MDRVGRDFLGVVVEGLRQGLECETRREAVHALVDPGSILVLLQRARLGVDFLQALPVIDAHLGVEAGILVRLQAREDGEAGQHLERRRGA